VLGGGTGYEARTEGEFAAALAAALGDQSGLSLLHVYLPRSDCSRPLARLASRLAQRV
jgi:indolepyruvate decarboxylase